MQNRILEANDLKKILPQRYPFLMIDRVIEASPDKVVAIKNVTINEPFFEGHFPGNPVMPGVLLIEAMAQAGIVLVYYAMQKKHSDFDTGKQRICYLGGVSKARFFEPVVPGVQLRIEVLPVKLLAAVGIIKGTIFINDTKACQAQIAFGMREA